MSASSDESCVQMLSLPLAAASMPACVGPLHWPLLLVGVAPQDCGYKPAHFRSLAYTSHPLPSLLSASACPQTDEAVTIHDVDLAHSDPIVGTLTPLPPCRAHAPTWRAILWGLEQGLTPDADLFELFIHALALMPRRHPWATQILKYDMRVRPDLQILQSCWGP